MLNELKKKQKKATRWNQVNDVWTKWGYQQRESIKKNQTSSEAEEYSNQI